jgi:hypothetical protein
MSALLMCLALSVTQPQSGREKAIAATQQFFEIVKLPKPRSRPAASLQPTWDGHTQVPIWRIRYGSDHEFGVNAWTLRVIDYRNTRYRSSDGVPGPSDQVATPKFTEPPKSLLVSPKSKIVTRQGMVTMLRATGGEFEERPNGLPFFSHPFRIAMRFDTENGSLIAFGRTYDFVIPSSTPKIKSNDAVARAKNLVPSKPLTGALISPGHYGKRPAELGYAVPMGKYRNIEPGRAVLVWSVRIGKKEAYVDANTGAIVGVRELPPGIVGRG